MNFKNKRLKISLDVKNPLDIKGALVHIANEIANAEPIGAGKYESGSYEYEIVYTEFSDFKEVQIGDKWYRIIESKINKP